MRSPRASEKFSITVSDSIDCDCSAEQLSRLDWACASFLAGLALGETLPCSRESCHITRQMFCNLQERCETDQRDGRKAKTLAKRNKILETELSNLKEERQDHESRLQLVKDISKELQAEKAKNVAQKNRIAELQHVQTINANLTQQIRVLLTRYPVPATQVADDGAAVTDKPWLTFVANMKTALEQIKSEVKRLDAVAGATSNTFDGFNVVKRAVRQCKQAVDGKANKAINRIV